MTDKNYRHKLVIVDRSGSMFSCAHEMRAALDSYFDESAKVEGKTLVDYVQFDNVYEHVLRDTPVTEARATLNPRGATALLDAVGKSVTELGARFAALPEHARPDAVEVVVVTDGYENASKEWTASAVKELVERQRDEWNWDFVFLGANLDAPTVAAGFGFDPNKSITYDTRNIASASAALNNYTTRSAKAGAAGNTFTYEEREAQGVEN